MALTIDRMEAAPIEKRLSTSEFTYGEVLREIYHCSAKSDLSPGQTDPSGTRLGGGLVLAMFRSHVSVVADEPITKRKIL